MRTFLQVRGGRFLTLLCSPFHLEALVLGYLRPDSLNLYAGDAIDLG